MQYTKPRALKPPPNRQRNCSMRRRWTAGVAFRNRSPIVNFALQMSRDVANHFAKPAVRDISQHRATSEPDSGSGGETRGGFQVPPRALRPEGVWCVEEGSGLRLALRARLRLKSTARIVKAATSAAEKERLIRHFQTARPVVEAAPRVQACRGCETTDRSLPGRDASRDRTRSNRSCRETPVPR